MPQVLFSRIYDSESLCDVERDVIEAFDPAFTPAMANIPQDEHGFHAGSFRVTVEWIKDE